VDNWITYIVALYYISLMAEIIWIPVPSVSSTWQLIFPSDEMDRILNKESLLYKFQHFNFVEKAIWIIIPYVVSTMGYCYPIFMLILFYFGKIEIDITIFSMIGVFCLILGRLITIYSAFTIRKNNSQKNEEFELKTKGIFRKSRNPIVLGLHVGVFGMILIFPSLIFLILTIVYILHIHFKIVLEEDFLRQLFKDNYKTYHSKTKRYL
jgi:protein-S-isoprenylcysteine O-methyltransferase Ste14